MSLRVFVSSRMGQELGEFREEAYRVIRDVGCYPVLYEKEPGSPEHFREWWHSRIQNCDIFVLLLRNTISPAVLDEVKAAWQLNKPMLVAVIDPPIYESKTFVPVRSSSNLPEIDESSLGNFYRWIDAPKVFFAPDVQTFNQELSAALWGLPEVASGLPADLRKLAHVFVPPVQYGKIRDILSSHRLVVIHGPPHVGKTAAALHAAGELRDDLGLRAVVRLRSTDQIEYWQTSPEVVFLLDDWFGPSSLSAPSHAEQFGNLIRLSQRYPILVTTRSQVLLEAMQRTRLGESNAHDRFAISLSQEGSYDDASLMDVLARHLDFMQSELVDRRNRLETAQVELARERAHHIIRQLRFPHNIERLCALHLAGVTNEVELNAAVEEAKEIEKQTRRWAEALDPAHRWLVFLVALFPAMSEAVLRMVYKKASLAFGFVPDNVSHLVSVHQAYLANPLRPDFGHPSYREAVIDLLRELYRTQVGQIVDFGLGEVLRADVFSFARSEEADYGWPRPYPQNTVLIEDYLQEFVDAYDHLRLEVFPKLQTLVAPYVRGRTAAVFVVSPDSHGGTLLLLPSSTDTSVVSTGRALDGGEPVAELMEKAKKANRPLAASHIRAGDLSQRSPQMHAFTMARDGVNKLFDKQRLHEAWPLIYRRLEKSLRYLGGMPYGLHVDWKEPLTEDGVRAVGMEFQRLAEQEPPRGYHPEGWKLHIATYAKHTLAVRHAFHMLRKQGIYYTGPFLPQPERYTASAVWANYPAEQMKVVLERALTLGLDSYRAMAEMNFTRVSQRMHLYQNLPIRILGFVAYGPQFTAVMDRFYFLPIDFPTVHGRDVELHVVTTDDFHRLDPPPLPAEVIEREKEAQESRIVRQLNSRLSTFLLDDEYIKMVYDWLKRDLDAVLGWRSSGSGRTSHLLGQGNQLIDFATYIDPFEVYDWP